MEELIKNLSKPEAKHRYWHIRKDERSFFPESLQVFKMEFDGKTYDVRVNHKDDIMTGQFYEKFRFLEGDRIIITKKKNGTYALQAPDTLPYPGV